MGKINAIMLAIVGDGSIIYYMVGVFLTQLENGNENLEIERDWSQGNDC